MLTDTPNLQSLTGTKRTKQPVRQNRARQQPKYRVILWNDDDHSFHYVVRMLKDLFGLPHTKGWQLANEVHYHGQVVILTTSYEHAELKREQIQAFGRDPDVRRCCGSMSVTIAPLT